ncbi:N/A [soil metagenome]
MPCGNVLADLVRLAGHEVVAVVASGLDAIQAFHRLHPDLLLMDYYMARLNGGIASRNILARDPQARIVLVSAAASPELLSDYGALAVLPKPLELAQLEKLLKEIAAGLP